MSGLEDYQALNDTLEQAWAHQRECKRLGVALATANADFRAKKAARLLRLTAGGMTATQAREAVYADEVVNRAAMVAEVAQTDYDTEREAVMLSKREVDILREQIARDWQCAGRV